MSDNPRSAEEILRQLHEEAEAAFRLTFDRETDNNFPPSTSTTIQPFITEATRATTQMALSTLQNVITTMAPSTSTFETTMTSTVGQGAPTPLANNFNSTSPDPVNYAGEIRDGLGLMATHSVVVYCAIGISTALGVLVAIFLIVYWMPGSDSTKLNLIRSLLSGFWSCMVAPWSAMVNCLFPAPLEAACRDLEAAGGEKSGVLVDGVRAAVGPSTTIQLYPNLEATESTEITDGDLEQVTTEEVTDGELAQVLTEEVADSDKEVSKSEAGEDEIAGDILQVPIYEALDSLEDLSQVAVYNEVEGTSRPSTTTPTTGADPPALAWQQYRQSPGYESDCSSLFTTDPESDDGGNKIEAALAEVEASFEKLACCPKEETKVKIESLEGEAAVKEEEITSASQEIGKKNQDNLSTSKLDSSNPLMESDDSDPGQDGIPVPVRRRVRQELWVLPKSATGSSSNKEKADKLDQNVRRSKRQGSFKDIQSNTNNINNINLVLIYLLKFWVYSTNY